MDPLQLHSTRLLFITALCLFFRPSTMLESRIVGGSEISIMEVPFMLSLRLNDDHICGASIISTDWAITAAHCVTTYVANVSNYSIRSGSSMKDSGGEIHNVSTLIWHERYSDVNNDFDIAVLKVDPPFKLDETTQPIDLPGNEYINDTWGIVAGWGYYMYPGNVLSEDLRYAFIPKIDRNECASEYAGRYQITPRQVCYGYEQGSMDSCKGDSGGPLYTVEKILIGLISWGEDCAGLRSPGVYTTTFLFPDWIADKTGVRSRL